jgi:predicted acetyltransferase
MQYVVRLLSSERGKMPNIEIRRVRGDEAAEAWVPLGAYAFDQSPPLPDRAEWDRFARSYEFDPLHLVLFEDGKPAASAARTRMTQNLRGTLFPAAGIWGVAVHPSMRRKGYARRLVGEMLAAMRDEGSAVTTLYPFRESFYARLGYTTFPQPRMASFAPQQLLPLLSMELAGTVELLAIKDGAEELYDYLERHQRGLHGMGLFGRAFTTGIQRDENNAWLALARVDGRVTGAMSYELKESPRRMIVRGFYYDDFRARYLLLEWCARHVDQVKEVEVKLPPGETPETWMVDLNVQIRSGYPPMGRVLDVARLSGMVVGPGSFTASVRDEQCPWNNGVFRFAGVDGTLQVEPAGQAAECELAIQALSALIFGTHEPETFALRGWGEPSPVVQRTLRDMFPPMLPYLHETF